MNFLAPLFLFGALAVAGPVIFHLIRRTIRDKQRFGSLMFLSPTPPRLTKRSRIDNWLLMLLRMAALALLALAFARPFFRAATLPISSGEGGDRTVVLLDTSSSLRRDGMWESAKMKASNAVEQASANGEVAVVTFDHASSTILKFDDWHNTAADVRLALAKERIAAVKPGWSGTNAGAALMSAAEMLAESGKNAAGNHSIVLITDAQEGSRLEALQGYDWPKGISLRIETIAPKKPGNAGLQLAAEAGSGSSDAVEGARLRVSNSADAQTESFQVGWQGANGEFDGKEHDVYVPPGQSRIVMLPWQSDKPKNGRAMLRGDSEAFDNVVNVSPPPTLTVPVIHSGSGPEAPGPLYFLQKALPAGRALTATMAAFAPNALPPPDVLKSAPLWVVTAPVETAVSSAIEAFATSGGTALIMLSSVEMAASLQAIMGASPISLKEVKPATYALLGTIDFSHPLFRAFAEPRVSDFTKIRFSIYFQIVSFGLKEANVLASFDSGDPAVIEVKQGNGRVFILTAGWHPASSQLALSSKFPSLLGSLLASTGAGAPMPAQFFAGETVIASAFLPTNVEKATIVSPDGKSVLVSRNDAVSNFIEPGWYQVSWDGGSRDVAVNVDPAESRTMPLAIEEFEKLGAPVVTAAPSKIKDAASENSPAAAEESESRQKIWRWLIAAVFAVLFIETLLGTRAAKRYATTEGGTIV